jgi:hypothetical protein
MIMKFIKPFFIVLVLIFSLALAQPVWADQGKLKQSSDYAEVTQTIEGLLASDAATQTGLQPAEIQQKLADLQFQKYILETAKGRAQCANQTGKTLAIYTTPKKAIATQLPTLSFLADGEVTDDDFVCNGVYLPAGTKVGFSLAHPQPEELAEPVAIRIVNGAQLIAQANPDTSMITINVPPMQIFNAGEVAWEIPTLTQAEIDTQTPNAPAD